MISVILIEPRHPGNIGSIARVMHNFGYSDLALVDPLCSAKDPEARRLAVRAQKILDTSRRLSFEKLRKEFDVLIATTSKVGTSFNLPRTPLRPDELADALYGQKKRKIGILFGRETDGLHNDEIKACDFSVTIPTPAPTKTSALNLSHAVAIILYELSKKDRRKKIDDHIDPAEAIDLKVIARKIDDLLEHFEGFLRPEQIDTQRLVWKRVFAKSFLTKREAFAVMGFFSHLSKLYSRK